MKYGLLLLNSLLLVAQALPQSLLPAATLPQEPAWDQLAKTDWLLDNRPFRAGLYRGENEREICLSNGLIRRTFRIAPNAATVGFDQLASGTSLLRGVKPEAEITVDGVAYPIGGLIGQPNYAFLLPEWIDQMAADPAALQLVRFEQSEPVAPFTWKQVRRHASGATWPPSGVHLKMDYHAPGLEGKNHPLAGLRVSVHYELYDGVPVLAKWIEVHNVGKNSMTLDAFTSEILAAVEHGSSVESRKYTVAQPHIHVETDYAFASMYAEDANHHAVHWEADATYETQVNYLKRTPCLLKVGPEIGPAQVLEPGDRFVSFRTFLLPHDSSDRERQGLARRRMYRVLAPWTTENPLMMHARFADWEGVKTAIDQAAAVGFEMVILTFGSGFNIEDDSPEYLQKMKQYADYARSKGVEIGGYSLLASRSIDPENDVLMPEGQNPTFGHSPCIGSKWGEEYFIKLYRFYEQTGFSLLEHDGSYPGDPCLSTAHPGHRTYADSRWNQYRVISDFYKWCRSQGIYLNIPDYYYLTGGNKCGMGYRETNWSLPREQQVIHTRQNIYDGTWDKLVTMGWMFVPLTEYHGGGEAATIEPLHDHLDHYERMMVSNLGAGVQACYRGPRLFDTEETRSLVEETVGWYKKHREVLEGDLIHLRRADGRDLDYWLMVNPGGKEKGALLVFNPLNEDRETTLRVPLYYAGPGERVRVFQNDVQVGEYTPDRQYTIDLPVRVPAGKWTAVFF